MSALRTIARNGRAFVELREKPLAACRRIARGMNTPQLHKSVKQPPAEVARSAAKRRYWVAVVNDELVGREALDNARKKLALRDKDRAERTQGDGGQALGESLARSSTFGADMLELYPQEAT